MSAAAPSPYEVPAYHLVLQIASGSGIISRKPQAVLYLPRKTEGTEKLLTAFVTAPDGAELEAIADAIVENDFAVPPFACVQIGRDITLRAFGDVEIRTDQRSVLSLRGDHSSTWVDHRIHGRPDAAEIGVTDSELDEVTDLVLGTVHAGGFNLLVTSTGSQVALDAPASVPASPIERVDLRPPAPPSPTDPAFLKYVLEAFETDEALRREPDPVPEPLTVDARVCSAGHLNEPSRATCALCDEDLDGTPRGLTPVGRPGKRMLVFDDGERLELDGDLVIGRNPDRIAASANATPYVVNGDRVSRAHLILRVRGWNLLVEDCGSRNGSVLVPSEGRPPIALTAGSPVALESGASVYFGAKSFTVER